MCEICRSYPCKAQCPNFEAEVVEICCECGIKIYEGDDYYDIDGTILCEDCTAGYKRTAERSE